MLPVNSSRQGSSGKHKIKIINSKQLSLNKQSNQPHNNNKDSNHNNNQQLHYSFNHDNNQSQNYNHINNYSKNHSIPKYQQHFNHNNISTFNNHNQQYINNKQNQPSSILLQLNKKLLQISYSILQSQYGPSFTQNSSHFQYLNQLKYQQSTDKLLHNYTSILLFIIQQQQKQKFNSQPKYKYINLHQQQRTKLKLILTQTQQKQINKFKNKGLQTYVKKIQQQSQKHKRQHIRIKQRNRIIENQLLKLSLQFKNKRQLYITEITRLTEILHSSFMEVGKMFINYSNPNSNIYPPNLYNKFENKNIYTISQQQQSNQTQNNINYQVQQNNNNNKRKIIKSLSPVRRVQQFYNSKQKQQTKLPQYIPQCNKMNSLYQNYLKPQSANIMKKNKQIYNNNLLSYNNNNISNNNIQINNRTNRHFDVESEPGGQEKLKGSLRGSQLSPKHFMSNTMNINKPINNF